MDKILLDLRELGDGVSRRVLEGEAASLALGRDDYTLHSPLRIVLDVDKSEGEIMVTGEVTVPAQVECGRCACLFAEEVRGRLRARYIRTRGDAKPKCALSDDGVFEISRDERVLDLTDEVRETVCLALPIRALCSPECRGLCPTCGANLNEEACCCERRQGHPAWSALEKLKNGGRET